MTQAQFTPGQCDSESGFPLRIPFSEWLDNFLSNRSAQNATQAPSAVAVFLLDPGLARLASYVDDNTLDWVQRDLIQQLRSLNNYGFTIGRFAYSRFAVVIPHLESIDNLAQVSEQVLFACSLPANIEGLKIGLQPKMGIALAPQHGEEAPQLLEAARAALTCALENANESTILYSDHLGREVFEKMRREVQLNNALQRVAEIQRANDSMVFFSTETPTTTEVSGTAPFTLLYQPCLDIQQGKLATLDTSLQWAHPDYHQLTSAQLLEYAAQLGQANALGQWWFSEVVQCWQGLRQAGFEFSRIGMPLVYELIAHPHFLTRLQDACQQYGLLPKHVEFVLNENVLTQDPQKVLPTLRDLQAQGFHLTINHFGSGSASLAELQQYPIDGVSIDPTFVRNIHRNADDHAIVRSILSITRWLSKTAIADGVQLEAQVALLQRNGCHLMRGPWFMPAVPATQLRDLLGEPAFQEKLHPHSGNDQPTLLLLDDEPNILSALKRALRRDGYQIFTTTDPEEAFQILAANRIDVVLSDQRMPIMSGTEFLKRVKDLHPRTMRMVLSGYTEVQSITDAINEGAIYKFLTKPWDDEQLRANIAEAFRRLSIESENERLQSALEQANQDLIQLNHSLEQRVEQKSMQAARDLEFLRITQEMLDTLPLAMIGVDDNDMVATANETALIWLGRGHTLVGEMLVDVLPMTLVHELMKFRVGERDEWAQWIVIQGLPTKAIFRRMGQRSHARGVMVILQHLLEQGG